jgi:hypothetical protein
MIQEYAYLAPGTWHLAPGTRKRRTDLLYRTDMEQIIETHLHIEHTTHLTTSLQRYTHFFCVERRKALRGRVNENSAGSRSYNNIRLLNHQ